MKHLTATSLTKFVLAIFSIMLFTGCTAIVENRILNTGPMVSGVGDLKQWNILNRFNYCMNDSVPAGTELYEVHNDEEQVPSMCFSYYDFADFVYEIDGEITTVPKSTFTFTHTSPKTKAENSDNSEDTSGIEKNATTSRRPNFSEEMEFTFPELKENPPIVVLAPGYGMEAPHMTFWASWFRSVGLHPIILPGPNEYPPMQFGLNYPPLIANMLVTQYADRPIILFGFSMGALSALALEQELLAVGVEPEALMLVAPMHNFRDQALTVYQTIRERDWRVRWFVSEGRYSAALNRIIARSEIAEEELNVYSRLEKVSTPMVIAASRDDDIVDYETLRAGIVLAEAEAKEFFPFPEYSDFSVAIENIEGKDAQLISLPHLSHGIMFMLLHPLRTPLQEWLSTRVELTFAPETEYPKHSEEQTEALQ